MNRDVAGLAGGFNCLLLCMSITEKVETGGCKDTLGSVVRLVPACAT